MKDKQISVQVYRKTKTGWQYWKTMEFSHFIKFENFVWQLFEKGYEIAEASTEVIEDVSMTLSGTLSTTEMWICNKKNGRCYLFEPTTDQENDLFDFLFHYLPLKKKIKPKELKEFRKKKEELIKKRNRIKTPDKNIRST